MPVSDLSEEEIHRRALKMLLSSRQDKLRPTYMDSAGPCALLPSNGQPRRPRVIEAALPGRFEIVYDEQSTPIDRIDRGPFS